MPDDAVIDFHPSMSIDAEADAATLRLRPGLTARSERVHRALVADYDETGALTSVELLSLAAIAREGVVVSEALSLASTQPPAAESALSVSWA